MQRRLRPFSIDTYPLLLGVAKGKVKADLYLKGATVLNVYTGEWLPANVAIKGKHIAYAGLSEQMVGADTEVTDLTGKYVVPGYIEPHSHPFQVYNPDTLTRFVLSHGTTTLVNDNMGLYLAVKEATFRKMMDEVSEWPVKMLWSLRLDPQTYAEEFRPFFEPDVIGRLLRHPFVVQAGELTGWPQLVAGDPQITENLLETLRIGKRVEGHLPGASLETLSMLTAAGVTADHEAMTAEEVLLRLRIGLWTTLRYSSLRPDLPQIVQELINFPIDTKRLMMTTDGSTPAFLEKGYTDHMLRVAIQAGVDPIKAYQMVTINPATYYGLDAEIGGIAPGRLADLLVLEAIDQPTPTAVLAEGRWVARDRTLLETWPQLDWKQYGLTPLRESWRVTAKEFVERTDLPVIRLENPAITRLQTDSINPSAASEGAATSAISSINAEVVATWIDRTGSIAVDAALEGMATQLDGLASSYTASQGILVLGQNRAAMAQAVNRVLVMGGGIVLVKDGKVQFELPMLIAGGMSTADMDAVIEQTKTFERLLQEQGHIHYDPVYTLLFLTSTHLPEVRLTPEGVLHVKTGTILRLPRRIAPALT